MNINPLEELKVMLAFNVLCTLVYIPALFATEDFTLFDIVLTFTYWTVIGVFDIYYIKSKNSDA